MKRNIITSVLKVAGAVGVILVAGWAIVTLSPRGASIEVQEAEADIWGLEFAEKSKNEKFVGVLKEMGMEQPRAYNWNGNRVFFSTMTTSASPKSVMRTFQDEFARTGVNKKAHYSIPNRFSFENIEDIKNAPPEVQQRSAQEIEQVLAWQDDFWGGGVVPVSLEDDVVQMMGTQTLGESDNSIDAVQEILMSKTRRPDDNVKSMRYVDAFRQSNGKTRVTSVWSDENLNLRKFQNDAKFEDRVYEEGSIPSCMGCERVMRFEGTAAEKAYVANVFEGTAPPESSLRFYEQALTNRGWQRSDSSKVMDRAREIGMMPRDIGTLDVYAKGGQFLTVSAQPSTRGGTLVQVMEMP